MDIHGELHRDLDRAGRDRLEYVRRAFGCLPRLENPRILDAGCGNGDVTIELARLGGGEVTGIDIDVGALGRFERRIEEEGLGSRVRAVHGSMLDIPFPPESFDVIWAEGSLHIVGVGRALESMHDLLRPGGFLVMHESAWIGPDPPRDVLSRWSARYPEIRDMDDYGDWIALYGYRLIESFALPEDFWWNNYYGPLGRRIERLREKYSDNPGVLAILDGEQQEVDLFDRSSRWFGSAYFVMQRDDR
jgi:SAM-dependent methyltransferase